MVPVLPGQDEDMTIKNFKIFLRTLRIQAEILLVTVDYISQSDRNHFSTWVNSLILSKKSPQTIVTFFQLSRDIEKAIELIHPECNDHPSILADVGPAVLAYGLKNVISR